VSEQPFLQVVSGDPTPAELAAVTVLLTALTRAGGESEQPRPAGGWSDLSLRIGRPPAPGPGAWRNSTWC
jgi:Acyl-CoA carboxylase epsilon subunit